MNPKELVQKFVPQKVWKTLRERKILKQHRHVASICEMLIEDYRREGVEMDFRPVHTFPNDKIIWQYWAQGYDNVPELVAGCLQSVDKYCSDYMVVRLSDDNLSDYLEIPEWLEEKRRSYSHAHFADVLRLMLLSAYGGVWLDATMMFSAPISDCYANRGFFVFQRDSKEKNKSYWEGTYAYYFGWSRGFRVNMLNSFIVSPKGNKLLDTLCGLMLKWWRENDCLPDYFFFQILFDVLIHEGGMGDDNCAIVSDCLPHYLQQCINDPKFALMPKVEILAQIPIHKLTYK